MKASPECQAASLAEGAKQQFSGDIRNRNHTGEFMALRDVHENSVNTREM